MNKLFLYIPLLFILSCTNQTKDKNSTKQDLVLPEEISRLNQLAKQFPDSVGLHMRLVNALDSMGSYALALEELNTLII